MNVELQNHQRIVELIKFRGGNVYIDPELNPINLPEEVFKNPILDKDNMIIGMLEDGCSFYKITKDLGTSYYKIKKLKDQLGL